MEVFILVETHKMSGPLQLGTSRMHTHRQDLDTGKSSQWPALCKRPWNAAHYLATGGL